MPQIADKCFGVFNFCRTRVTLLADDGSPASPITYYVTDKPVSMAVTADIDEGVRRTVRNGCDCVTATKRGDDALLGYTFELVNGSWEPALEAMMLGYDAIVDESDDPVTIGWNIAGEEQFACGGTQAKVALEAWALLYDGSGPDVDYPYMRFVWPLTKWQTGPATLSVDPMTPTLTGFNERNDNWHDLYLDWPDDGTTPIDINFHARFGDTAANLPEATCGLLSAT